MTYLGDKNFYLEVAKGDVFGHLSVNKFGHNDAVSTSGEDVWMGGGTYNFFPTTAQVCNAQSDSGQDATGGTGAVTIQVYGLDENWELQEETVTLNGVTSVTLANTYIRLFRCVVLTCGSNGTNVGNITVTGGGNTGIYVSADDGQTQQAIYTIPAGYSGYFIKGYVATADDDKNGEVAEFQWKARPNNGTTGAWAVKGQIGLNTLGSSSWQYEYGVPNGAIPEKTDIKLECIATTAVIGVVGGFDLVLVKN